MATVEWSLLFWANTVTVNPEYTIEQQKMYNVVAYVKISEIFS